MPEISNRIFFVNSKHPRFPVKNHFQSFWESGCWSSSWQGKERGLRKRLEIEPYSRDWRQIFTITCYMIVDKPVTSCCCCCFGLKKSKTTTTKKQGKKKQEGKKRNACLQVNGKKTKMSQQRVCYDSQTSGQTWEASFTYCVGIITWTTPRFCISLSFLKSYKNWAVATLKA